MRALLANLPNSRAQQQALTDAMLDISRATHVQVEVREDKKVLWINVNGVCVLRVCAIENLEILP